MINDHAKHFKEMYKTLLLTLTVSFIWITAVKVDNKTNVWMSIKQVWSAYLFHNQILSISVFIVLFSPIIYVIVKTIIKYTFPASKGAISHAAKTKNIVSRLAGATMGIGFLIIILVINNKRFAVDTLLLCGSILWLITFSVFKYGAEYNTPQLEMNKDMLEPYPEPPPDINYEPEPEPQS